MGAQLVQVVFIIAGFAAVAISSLINWKSQTPPEPFNIAKFASAYLRSAWAIVSLAIALSELGLTVESIMAILAAGFGIDNVVLKSREIGKRPEDG